ncbi:MAG: lactate utilization protein C [Bifidobacteriaceae bacterium]|jgi:L-lactate dehydrogenase complex protein LldG|nr:lactate utilization protein C [Bifidobacteriaceae bacterium]
MNARDEVLARIRSGLADVPAGSTPDGDVPVPWVYEQPTEMPDVLERFVERCRDYKAVVERVAAGGVATAVAQHLTRAGVASVVLPAGLEAAWREAIVGAGVAVHSDDPPLSAAELDAIGGVVTAARVGIAETGTIVLDHAPDQGRRALSLVPDVHLCVIGADQVVSDVPQAVALLRPSVDAGRPLTWISGPSATSDIELQRVEGVHGPRTLIILLSQ